MNYWARVVTLVVISALYLVSSRALARSHEKILSDTLGVYDEVVFENRTDCSKVFEPFYFKFYRPILDAGGTGTMSLTCFVDEETDQITLRTRIILAPKVAGDTGVLHYVFELLKQPIAGKMFRAVWVKDIVATLDFVALRRDPAQGDTLRNERRTAVRLSSLTQGFQMLGKVASYSVENDPAAFRKLYEVWFNSSIADAMVATYFPISNYFRVKFDGRALLEDNRLVPALTSTQVRNCQDTASGFCDAPLSTDKQELSLRCDFDQDVPEGAKVLTACYEGTVARSDQSPSFYVKTSDGRLIPFRGK